LKLKFAELLSMFAFNFNLRRCLEAVPELRFVVGETAAAAFVAAAGGGATTTAELKVVFTVGPDRCCSPRQPTHLNPRFLNYVPSYDVASNF